VNIDKHSTDIELQKHKIPYEEYTKRGGAPGTTWCLIPLDCLMGTSGPWI